MGPAACEMKVCSSNISLYTEAHQMHNLLYRPGKKIICSLRPTRHGKAYAGQQYRTVYFGGQEVTNEN